MALNHSIKNGIRALATTAITGAAGTTQGLTSINMVANNVETGTLAAKVTSTATTNNLTLSGKRRPLASTAIRTCALRISRVGRLRARATSTPGRTASATRRGSNRGSLG